MNSKLDLITVPLELPFKGERNYLHGTNIYDALTEYFSSILRADDVRSIDLTMHEFARRQCDLVYRSEGGNLPRPELGVAEVSVAGRIRGWLVETQRPVQARVNSDEEVIVDCCAVGDSVCRIRGCDRQNPIDVLIAMTKVFHSQHFGDDGKRWVLGRLQLPSRWLLADDSARFSIVLEQVLGTRLTASSIFSGEEKIGKIFFTKAPK